MTWTPPAKGTKNYTDAEGNRRKLPPGEELPEGASWGWGSTNQPASDAPLDTEPDFGSPYEPPAVVPGSLRGPSSEVSGRASEPEPRKRSWRDRLTGKKDSTPKPAKEGASRSVFRSDDTPPRRPNKKRVSAVEDFADTWGWAGGMFARNPVHIPSGRMMQFSAPIAGEILDEAVAGTVIDRVIVQPAVQMRSRFDGIAGLIAPIAIVWRMETHPAEAEQMLPFLKSALRRSLPFYVPAIKKAKARAEREREALEALAPELMEIVDPMTGRPFDDPIDGIVAMLFDGWQAPPQPEGAIPSEEQPNTANEGIPA